MIVRLEAKTWKDVPAMVAAIGEAFGIEANNRDALVDGLTQLDQVRTGGRVFPGEVVLLAIEGAYALKSAPQVKQLAEIAAFVNWRRLEQGQPPILALAYEP